MVRLFAQEVPEIYDGVIEIRAVARDPGSPRQDRGDFQGFLASIRSAPASACAACACRRWCRNCRASASTSFPGRAKPRPSSSMRWRRPKSPRWCWTKTPTASKWWCPTNNLSLGIGRRGQNVRLASQLTGWQIDILTEAEESERRQKEFATRTQLFMESLDVDETVAQLLGIRRLRHHRRRGLCRCRRTGPDRSLRRGNRAGAAKPRAGIHRSPQQGNGRQAQGAGRRGRGAGSRRRHPGDGRGAGRRRHQDAGRSGGLRPPTICSAITRPTRTRSACGFRARWKASI